MTGNAPRRPTDAELEILRVIWDLGEGTVRQVHQALGERPGNRGSGYTTVLKHMQIMVEKGLLLRDETVRPQVFRPSRSRERTQRQLLRHLLDKAFSGSTGSLVMQALSDERATPEESAAIRELLDALEAERGQADDGVQPEDGTLQP